MIVGSSWCLFHQSGVSFQFSQTEHVLLEDLSKEEEA